MAAKVKCATKQCLGRATVIRPMLRPNGQQYQVQFCKPCANAWDGGCANGWNMRREIEIVKELIHNGY